MALPLPKQASNQQSELDHYLSADMESVVDALAWWDEKRVIYPQLSRMAFDYLSIPGEQRLNCHNVTTYANCY
jgi:hypothetical protein